MAITLIDPPRLTVQHGRLHIQGHMLMRFYPAGDCDTCPWPMSKDPEKRHAERLAIALYDARECHVEGHFDAVILPDGTHFAFDALVP